MEWIRVGSRLGQLLAWVRCAVGATISSNRAVGPCLFENVQLLTINSKWLGNNEKTMTGTLEKWYGLDAEGNEIQISHHKLMDWAYDNDLQITVGWSHDLELNGKRVVRGPKMIERARLRGWNDLADKLEKFGFSDTE